MSKSPRVDAALGYVNQGVTPETMAHPERWLLRVAQRVEEECAAWKAFALHQEDCRVCVDYCREGLNLKAEAERLEKPEGAE